MHRDDDNATMDTHDGDLPRLEFAGNLHGFLQIDPFALA
jgi:hypothetical protein